MKKKCNDVCCTDAHTYYMYVYMYKYVHVHKKHHLYVRRHLRQQLLNKSNCEFDL